MERPNILIVDDTKANLAAIHAILKELEANIYMADSGNAALEELTKREYAVVLLDVQMPHMDGFEVLDLMQSLKKTRMIPVIFVTAISKEENYVMQGYELGAVDYLFKPLNPDIVRAKVLNFLKIYNLKQELAARNEDLANFAKMVCHDAVSPLRSISHSLRTFMETHDELSLEGKDCFMRVDQTVGRLITMLTDLMTHVHNRKHKADLVSVDLHKVVYDVLADLQCNIVSRAASVEVEPLGSVESSPTEIRMVIQNLIANAIKYVPKENSPKIVIKGEYISDGKQYRLKIIDNGIGIDPQQKNEIFQPFARCVSPLEYSGTGLGLTICKKMLECVQGEITVESELGKGSTFIVTLPAKG